VLSFLHKKTSQKIFVFDINCQSELQTKLVWFISHVLDEFATFLAWQQLLIYSNVVHAEEKIHFEHFL